jgi:hypothetical protein
MRRLVALLFLFSWAAALPALEFESGDSNAGTSSATQATTASGTAPASPANVPTLIDAGDVPTAYGLLKYEMRADMRFYEGGGILNKVYFGIFPRFFFGGALNVPNLVAAGPVTLTAGDASFTGRLILVTEDPHTPAIAIGWDGPAYDGGELRGLYAAASKEFVTPLGYFQIHGGVNNSYFENDWNSEDLRGFGAVTSTFRQVTGFCEIDEINNPNGPRLNAGFRVFFDPISLGLEFRGIGDTQEGLQPSRMLRASYSGLF